MPPAHPRTTSTINNDKEALKKELAVTSKNSPLPVHWHPSGRPPSRKPTNPNVMRPFDPSAAILMATGHVLLSAWCCIKTSLVMTRDQGCNHFKRPREAHALIPGHSHQTRLALRVLSMARPVRRPAARLRPRATRRCSKSRS